MIFYNKFMQDILPCLNLVIIAGRSPDLILICAPIRSSIIINTGLLMDGTSFFISYFISMTYYSYIFLIVWRNLSESVINYYSTLNIGIFYSSTKLYRYFINYYWELSTYAVGDNINILSGLNFFMISNFSFIIN
jgi:hypothetical protein